MFPKSDGRGREKEDKKPARRSASPLTLALNRRHRDPGRSFFARL